MTDIRLNLLTKKMKRDLAARLVFLLVKNLLAVILIAITAAAAALLGSKFALTNTFNALVEQSALITREYSGINSEIRTLNKELSQLRAVEDRSRPVSPILAHLFALAPPGISFSTVGIDTVNSLVRVRGRAATRDVLVGFRTALEGSPLLTKVRSPLSNIVLKTDIPFEFEAAIPEAPKPVPSEDASENDPNPQP